MGASSGLGAELARLYTVIRKEEVAAPCDVFGNRNSLERRLREIFFNSLRNIRKLRVYMVFDCLFTLAGNSE